MTAHPFTLTVLSDLGDGSGRRAPSSTLDFIGTLSEAEAALPAPQDGQRATIAGGGVFAHYEPRGSGWRQTTLVIR
jgi:hypothetical protein